MSIGLIGTKIGMTREFMETGQSVPVTVIKVEKGRVLDVISKDKRGYNAIKIGFFRLKNTKLTKDFYESVFPWLQDCEKVFGLEKKNNYGTQRMYNFLFERYMPYWFEKYSKVSFSSWLYCDLTKE